MYKRGKIKLVTRPSDFGNLFLPRQPFYCEGQFDLFWFNAITLYFVGSARTWTMTNTVLGSNFCGNPLEYHLLVNIL